MKLLLNYVPVPTLVLALGLTWVSPLRAQETPCPTIGKEIAAQIETAPGKILEIVHKALLAHEDCACDIITAAIRASGTDRRLIQDIVFTATSASIESAVTIAECAVAVAPFAAKEITMALEDAFGAEAMGKGKMVVGAREEPVIVDSEDLGLEARPSSSQYLRRMAGTLLPAPKRKIRSVQDRYRDLSDELSRAQERPQPRSAAFLTGGSELPIPERKRELPAASSERQTTAAAVTSSSPTLVRR